MTDLINERQRDINREFTPNVCNAMLAVYDACTAEVGPGQYNRMKVHMNNHITAQKDVMFQRATQAVRNMVTELVKAVEEHMADRTDQVFVGMRRDYLQVLSNVRVDDVAMPKWERSLRSKVEEIIQQSEEAFEAIIGGREVPVFEDEATAGADSDVDGMVIKNDDDEEEKKDIVAGESDSGMKDED
jgi:hypothetical protein